MQIIFRIRNEIDIISRFVPKPYFYEDTPGYAIAMAGSLLDMAFKAGILIIDVMCFMNPAER